MTFWPQPRAGLVVRYAFKWARDAAFPEKLGEDRPCTVITTAEQTAGRLVVYVAPITHQPPRAGQTALLLPPTIKQNLGLDVERSWQVVEEVNAFIWPSSELLIVRGGAADPVYGRLPPRFAKSVSEAVQAASVQQRLMVTRRSE